MARQDLGPLATRPTDTVTVAWVQQNLPSISSVTTASSDFTLTLPTSPVDHTMFIAEVSATADIVVSMPDGVLLCAAVQPNAYLHSGKTGFFGFRYSATADAWFLLSSTAQV